VIFDIEFVIAVPIVFVLMTRVPGQCPRQRPGFPRRSRGPVALEALEALEGCGGRLGHGGLDWRAARRRSSPGANVLEMYGAVRAPARRDVPQFGVAGGFQHRGRMRVLRVLGCGGSV